MHLQIRKFEFFKRRDKKMNLMNSYCKIKHQKLFLRGSWSFQLITVMAKEEIKVNNNVYKVTINDQTRMYAMKLNRLYQQGFSDVDSFDEISSEISNTINNLLKQSLSPEVREEDMDGAVKQLLQMFDKSKK